MFMISTQNQEKKNEKKKSYNLPYLGNITDNFQDGYLKFDLYL